MDECEFTDHKYYFIAEGEAIWQNVLAERLRRNSLNPVVVYCNQTLKPHVRVNSTEENATDSSTSNNSPPSLAASGEKKLICTVVSKLPDKNYRCHKQCETVNCLRKHTKSLLQ
jgi:hypothetical protein